MSNEGALATLDIDDAISRIAAGTLSKQIAAEFGVTPFAIRKRLAKHPDYKDAVAQQAHSFVEDSMAEIFSENMELDAVAIARARVRADTAFKYAKAHNPDYADKQTINVVIDIGNALVEARSRALQGATVGATIDSTATNVCDNQ